MYLYFRINTFTRNVFTRKYHTRKFASVFCLAYWLNITWRLMDHCLIQVIENWFKDVWTLNIDWQVTPSNSKWPLFELKKGLQLYFRVSEVWSSSVWGEIEHCLYSNMSRDTFSHSSHSGEGTVDRFLAIFSTRHFSASDSMRRAELQETQSTRKLPVLPATVSEFTVLLERNSVRSNFDWNPCFDPRFTGMFRRKAFLHWYTGEGMVRLRDFFSLLLIGQHQSWLCNLKWFCLAWLSIALVPCPPRDRKD